MLSGTYPDVIEQLAVTDRPQINAGDMAIINQPLDFLGVNYYTRTVLAPTNNMVSVMCQHRATG